MEAGTQRGLWQVGEGGGSYLPPALSPLRPICAGFHLTEGKQRLEGAARVLAAMFHFPLSACTGPLDTSPHPGSPPGGAIARARLSKGLLYSLMPLPVHLSHTHSRATWSPTPSCPSSQPLPVRNQDRSSTQDMAGSSDTFCSRHRQAVHPTHQGPASPPSTMALLQDPSQPPMPESPGDASKP